MAPSMFPHVVNKQALSILGCLAPLFAVAQFTADFTSGEGYVNGPLVYGYNWEVYDATGGDTNTFIVNVEGSGKLEVKPSKDGFQVAAFKGVGSHLSDNNYAGEMVFTLDYTKGTSATAEELIPILPQIQYASTEDNAEGIYFGLRQVKGLNQFNIFVVDTFNGTNQAAFSDEFHGFAIGLDYDSSDNWSDGQSDVLVLTFEATYLGDNQWEQTSVLTNRTQSTIIASASQTTTDKDGSFESVGHKFRILPNNMARYDVTAKVDKVGVTVSD